MKTIILFLLTTVSFAINPGKKAPDFTLVDQNGKNISLKDFKGKYTILEWFNHGCPFVRKHYDSRNMQNTQKTVLKESNFKWISIVSSAPGKQGYLANAAEARTKHNSEQSYANHLLLDPKGVVGRLYGAKTTPQIVIISPKGEVLYNGAIDSISSADASDIEGAKNYVLLALENIKNNQKIKYSKTRPYGCSVKY